MCASMELRLMIWCSMKLTLGSMLEIMDVENGSRKVLGGATGSWQAPNWSPDGNSLIYNADGLLYKF